MSSEYISTTEANKSIEVDGITLLFNDKEGGWAVPGGGHILLEGDAVRAAKSLIKSNTKLRQEKLAAKRVTRINAGSREGVDMVLGV